MQEINKLLAYFLYRFIVTPIRTTMNIIRLEYTDPDDIMDILYRLEKSFGIRFGEDDFMHVNTFGNLCDVIEKSISFEHQNDCR